MEYSIERLRKVRADSSLLELCRTEAKPAQREPIPTWALCYLINSDPSGLTEEDITMVDKWCNENGISVLSTASDQEGESSEPYFSHYPAFGLPTDVVDCNVIIY